ncbi:GlcNAc-transferase family protein [Enterobacteriaceae bacterium LUAb1]
MESTTIFISIASYRDTELLPTLYNMLKEAADPSRLHISVCWQDDNDIQPFLQQGMTLISSESDQDCTLHIFHWQNAIIHIAAVHYFDSKGACWARNLAERYYKQEDYFLQIDSHCRFAYQWDNEMIAMLENLRSQSQYPVITSYPPPYTPGEEEDRGQGMGRMVFKAFSTENIPRFGSIIFNSTTPVRSSFLAAGFIFSYGHFVENVPNDPLIFFEGEEISMAVRAYTHGYDLWTPGKPMIWHYYGRKDQPKVWSDHNNEAKESGTVKYAWWEHDTISKKRVQVLLGISNDSCDFGKYCLGTKRSIQEYSWMSGINFQEQMIHPDIMEPAQKSYFSEIPESHEEWLQQLRFANEKKIVFTKEELDISRNDILWWHIGVYNSQNTSVIIKTWSPEKIGKMTKKIDDMTTELQIDYKDIDEKQTYVVRVSPWLNTECWGTIVEKEW